MGKSRDGRKRPYNTSNSPSRRSRSNSDLEERLSRLEKLLKKESRTCTTAQVHKSTHSRRGSYSTSGSEFEMDREPKRPRRRGGYTHSDSSERIYQGVKARVSNSINKRQRSPFESPDSSEQGKMSLSPSNKRKRVIEDSPDSSEQEDPPVNTGHSVNKDQSDIIVQVNTDTEQFLTLKEDVLEVLGEDPDDKGPPRVNLHPALVARWSKILESGLDKEDRVNLVKKYPPPKNLDSLRAPEVNEEIVQILSQETLRKDKYLTIAQSQLCAATSAIGLSLNRILNEDNELLRAILPNLSDAGKLLTDLHHYLSISRRYGILPTIDGSIKHTIQNCNIDTKLFGSDLCDKVKSARELEKSSKDLRPSPSRKQYNKQSFDKHLNWKTPHHIVRKYVRHQGKVPQQHYQNYEKRNPQLKKNRQKY